METPRMTVQLLDERIAVHAGPVTDQPPRRPDPEVPERARRRTFTAKYKLDVLAEYEAAAPGAKGAILRREGLYSSHLVEWRRARDGGALAALEAPRGPRRPDARDVELVRLRREKARLEQELAKARFVVDVQAKLQALLEKLSESADTDSSSTP
jgi:transposase